LEAVKALRNGLACLRDSARGCLSMQAPLTVLRGQEFLATLERLPKSRREKYLQAQQERLFGGQGKLKQELWSLVEKSCEQPPEIRLETSCVVSDYLRPPPRPGPSLKLPKKLNASEQARVRAILALFDSSGRAQGRLRRRKIWCDRREMEGGFSTASDGTPSLLSLRCSKLPPAPLPDLND